MPIPSQSLKREPQGPRPTPRPDPQARPRRPHRRVPPQPAEALDHHGLVKIRFTDFKDEKKTLAVEIAGRAGAELIARVGNVAVYYRQPSVSP